ncbi:MAG: hypothetical protein IKC91_01435, partial [Clostridia bacterium]|nr:hypothetical protein [Clostridia bacterium]
TPLCHSFMPKINGKNLPLPPNNPKTCALFSTLSNPAAICLRCGRAKNIKTPRSNRCGAIYDGVIVKEQPFKPYS